MFPRGGFKQKPANASTAQRDGAGGSGAAAKLAQAFLLGKAPPSDYALVSLHQVLFDRALISRILAASRAGAKLGAKVNPSLSPTQIVRDPAFDWGGDTQHKQVAEPSGTAAASSHPGTPDHTSALQHHGDDSNGEPALGGIAAGSELQAHHDHASHDLDKGPPSAYDSPASEANVKPKPGALTPPSTSSSTPEDPVKTLRDAIAAHDHARTASSWSKLLPADHAKITSADVLSAFDVSTRTALAMMHSVGADFYNHAFAIKLLSLPKPEIWLRDLVALGLWDSFVKASPRHEEITKAQRDALAGFVDGANARPVFEKVYP